MIVLVTGGRDYMDANRVEAELDKLSPTLIVQGGATGADTLAALYGEIRGIEYHTYQAAWYVDGVYDPGAGPRRNQKMLDSSKPDVVLAFPGGSGTRDMVRRAEQAGVRVIKVPR